MNESVDSRRRFTSSASAEVGKAAALTPYTDSRSVTASDLMRTEIGDAEVVAVEFKSFPQVELVCGEALYAGIQVQLFAAVFSGVVLEPVHNKFAGAGGSHGCVGDEVVNIQYVFPRPVYCT